MNDENNNLEKIIVLFKTGNESDSYIDAVQFLHKLILESRNDNTFNRYTFLYSVSAIHNKLRYKYNQDYDNELLTWYRLFTGINEDNK